MNEQILTTETTVPVEDANRVFTTQAEETAAEADVLLARLAALGRNKKPGMREGFLKAFRLLVIPLAGLLVLTGFEDPAAAVVGFVILGIALALSRLTLSRGQAEAARSLANFDDLRAVGPFAEALTWPDYSIRRLARQRLTGMLPRLRASDSGLLNARQRASLYESLGSDGDDRTASFSFALLRALEQIGDADAIPAVEALATRRARTALQLRLQEAAKECLPALYHRAAAQRAADTLLRPSTGDTDDAALLRPAGHDASAEPATLVRAAKFSPPRHQEHQGE